MRLPSWLGDVVMALPALAALRQAHPEAEIVGEGRAYLESLASTIDELDGFIPVGDEGLKAAPARARTLAADGFDWAVLLPDSSRAALEPFLARIPVRVGYAREPARWLMTNVRVKLPREGGKRVPIPMTERYLAITRRLLCPDPAVEPVLTVQPAAAEAIASRLQAAGLADAELLLASPGAKFGSSKIYPADQFARGCDLIHERLGLHTVLAPGPGEEPLALAIAEAMQAPALVLTDPVTSLPELVALADRARLAFAPDSGARHVAVARGCPTVVVIGSTDPRHSAWRLERQRVLREDVDCSPCHKKVCPIDHRCMTRLHPERVADAAQELLA